jgi:hypothetical protein
VTKRSAGDNFNPKRYDGAKRVDKTRAFSGADSAYQLSRPMPFRQRFRPAVGTKDFSVLSDYDYASLWSRWRRGYELSMYTQQAYQGYENSYKYFYTNVINVGPYIPGYLFMYPTTRNDERMWSVFIQPQGSFNFKDFGLSVVSVIDYSDTVYAVKLSGTFGLPVSAFKGEVLANKIDAGGNTKLFGFGNYTVVGIGFDNVLDNNVNFTSLYNTLFLSHAESNSWEVVDANTLRVPAANPPGIGEFFTTELKAQCTCPDFLNRETVNLYEVSLKQRYPYTGVYNMKPGFYDAGSQATNERVVRSIDDPGWSRGFGFIYLNEIYNIPTYTQETYSDPNLLYFQPKWCKHIYAAMWDLQRRLGQTEETSYWLPQPNDEPTHPAYREMFDRDLDKQLEFMKRERDYRWWLRYGPTRAELPQRLLKPDTYNVFAKLTNAGTLITPTEVLPSGLTFFDINSYSPFVPPSGLDVYDGGTYASGSLIPRTILATLNGKTYASGILNPALFAYPINGGTYV